jgi:predicted regulator of Ras-like GTPase activity (Roadblock/LC7/MglB family)
MDREPFSDPTAFLDRICESVTGVRKAYISDGQGAILAESTGPTDDYALTLVRSCPTYLDRLNRLEFGHTQSMVVECGESSAVVLVSSPLFLTFLCEEDANFALLTEIPNEMEELLTQLKSFLETA